MKMVIDLKTLDGKTFDKALGEIETLAKKRGLGFKKIYLPTKTLTVDSGYELRIRRAMLTISNPDTKTVNEINEYLRPIAQNLEIEAKRLKNALAQYGKKMSEKYIQNRLGSKIEIQKGF
jgi:ribosomal protein S10